MTARLVDDDLLQRFHDGDTSDDEQADVRRKLDASEEDRRALSRLEQLSALFADVAKQDVEAAGAELDALYARVAAKVKAAPASTSADVGPKKADVVDLAARRRARTYIPVAALAAAAVLLVVFLVRPWTPAAVVTPGGGAGVRPPPGEVHASLLGSRVVDEDFGDGAGTVFSVSGEGGAQVAVVWVSDDEDTATP